MEIDTKKWRRWLFYIDIIVIAIFIISIVVLVQDAYMAGYHYGLSAHDTYLWNMARDVAFLTGSVAWVFYRFFRNEFLVLRYPW